MSAKPILNIFRDGAPLKSQPLEGEASVGRGDSCAMKLDDRAISRNHAVFRSTAEGVQIERKSEFAPLSVNGVDCTSAMLKEGDEVGIGPYKVKLTLAVSQDEIQPGAGQPKKAGDLRSVHLEPPTLALDDANGPVVSAQGAIPARAEAPEATLVFAPGDESAQDPFSQDVALEMVGAGAGQESASDEGVTSDIVVAGEDDPTRVMSGGSLDVALVIPAGVANVTELGLERDETSIGRDRGCDVVLNEKKASRKHAVIRREGIRFILLDLGSANGTYVNGERITEKDLEGGDRIRIGLSEIVFRAASAAYAAREQGFMPVPVEASVANIDGGQFGSPDAFNLGGGQASGDGGFPQEHSPVGGTFQDQSPESAPAMAGIPGLGAVPGLDPSRKQTLVDKFKALPPVRKAIWTAVIAGLIYFGLLEEDVPVRVAPTVQVSARPSGSPASSVDFDALPASQKKFIEAQHELAFAHLKNKEYDKAIFEIRKIFPILNDYKDSREIERYAIEGKRKLEALEEERRKLAIEEKIKGEVAQLVAEIHGKMKNREYEVAQALFSEILSRDPENQQVGVWKREIQEWEEKRLQEAKMEEVRKQVNRAAWDQYSKGLALKRRGRWHSAIAALAEVAKIDASDKNPATKARAMIAVCRESLRAARDPVLEKAAQFEGQGEMKKAFDLFQRATQIDPHHDAGFSGMARIRKVLHDRAKVTYTEAILAESYSDFVTARKKYRETLSIAPSDDIYHERSTRKLGRWIGSKLEESPQ